MTSARDSERNNKTKRIEKCVAAAAAARDYIIYYIIQTHSSRVPLKKTSGKVLEVRAYTWKFMATANFSVVILIGSFRPVKIQYGARARKYIYI